MCLSNILIVFLSVIKLNVNLCATTDNFKTKTISLLYEAAQNLAKTMSSSDTESDDDFKQILESVDTNLLNNSLFVKKSEIPKDRTKESLPKSQRYLEDDRDDDWTQISEDKKEFLFRKLSEIISEQISFFETEPPNKQRSKVNKKWRSKVKLFSGSDEYVQSYEDFKAVFNGPMKKPEIKRRRFEEEHITSEEDRLSSIVVTSASLLGANIQCNKINTGTLYEYKTGKDGGTCHFVEPITEFTVVRKKNNWSEKKISRNFKK